MSEDYAALIQEATQAADLAPAEYKNKTFEVVLMHLLMCSKTNSHKKEPAQSGTPSATERHPQVDGANGVLSKLGLSTDEWAYVFDEDENGVHIIISTRKLPGKSRAVKQVNLALLLLLALWKQTGQAGELASSEVSTAARQYSCHDSNVAKNLKGSGYFRANGKKYKLVKLGEEAAVSLVQQLGGSDSNG